MTTLRAFQRDFDLAGGPDVGLDPPQLVRLARALSTLAKRRQIHAGPFVIGCEDDRVDSALRDAFVQGALLSGEDVIDVGGCTAGEHESSLVGYGARGGIHLAHEDATLVSIAVFLAAAPLTGVALTGLCDIAEEGCFGSGEGRLTKRPVAEAEDSTHRTAVDRR